MKLTERIDRLLIIGDFLGEYVTNTSSVFKKECLLFREVCQNEVNYNPWFTEANVEYALTYWSKVLTQENLNKWMSLYTQKRLEEVKPKTVLIISAGNIPLVSFHDIISVFLSGHKAVVKLSSKDKNLIPFLFNVLASKHAEVNEFVTFAEGKVGLYDAVIATGSDMSQSYFESYFGKVPHIFRGHRNSIAVLTGKETKEELKALADDVFLYFGLGCRNVSKIFVPQNYNFDLLIEAFSSWEHVFYNHHYLNNYEYQKTIYLLNKESFIDGGFFMMKQSEKISSPIGVIFYDYYSDIRILAAEMKSWSSQVQCVVSKEDRLFESVAFGKTQQPNLWDYADNVDVINFLMDI